MQESQTRLAQLERNISELQKLLELKNQRLAELEKPAAVAAPTPAPVAKPEAVATKPEPTPPLAEPRRCADPRRLPAKVARESSTPTLRLPSRRSQPSRRLR